MDGGDYCVDYARSFRAPTSTDPSSIAFVALGGDACPVPKLVHGR
jgi:hypothetical protein